MRAPPHQAAPPYHAPQAVLRYPNGSRADVVARSGNISRASSGVATFPVLQVFAPPSAEPYSVEITPLDPRNRVLAPATLKLRLRRCVAGEANSNLTAYDAELRLAKVDFKCELCRFGTYR